MIRIRQLRESLGKQQKELALDLKVSQPTISDWESERKMPSSKSAKKLADYFGVSMDYLLGRTDIRESIERKSPDYDDETLELMEQMHKRPELKVLFSTSKHAKKEDIELVDEMLKRMAGYDHED